MFDQHNQGNIDGVTTVQINHEHLIKATWKHLRPHGRKTDVAPNFRLLPHNKLLSHHGVGRLDRTIKLTPMDIYVVSLCSSRATSTDCCRSGVVSTSTYRERERWVEHFCALIKKHCRQTFASVGVQPSNNSRRHRIPIKTTTSYVVITLATLRKHSK